MINICRINNGWTALYQRFHKVLHHKTFSDYIYCSNQYLSKTWDHLQFSPWLFQLLSDWHGSHKTELYSYLWIYRTKYVSLNKNHMKLIYNIIFRESDQREYHFFRSPTYLWAYLYSVAWSHMWFNHSSKYWYLWISSQDKGFLSQRLLSHLFHYFNYLGLPCGSIGKESTCNAGNLDSIPGFGRFPTEGKGYPLQNSGLENFMDHIVHGVAKSWTGLRDFHFHFN